MRKIASRRVRETSDHTYEFLTSIRPFYRPEELRGLKDLTISASTDDEAIDKWYEEYTGFKGYKDYIIEFYSPEWDEEYTEDFLTKYDGLDCATCAYDDEEAPLNDGVTNGEYIFYIEGLRVDGRQRGAVCGLDEEDSETLKDLADTENIDLASWGLEFYDDEEGEDEEDEEFEEAKRIPLKRNRKFTEARRMREASIHEYRFLISDGNGAASRGGESDTYFERKVRAANLKNAVIKIFPDLNYSGESFKEYLDNYYGDDPDRPEFETGEEILDWIEGNADITGGDPWIEGYAVDGKIINHPSYLNEILEECSREEAEDYLDGVDLDFWGLEFYDDDEEEEGGSDLNWDDWGYKPTYREMSHKFPSLDTTAIVATTNYLTDELAKASREKRQSFFRDKADFEKCTPERMISLLKEVEESLKGKKIYTDYERRDREEKLEAVDVAIKYLQSSKNGDLEEAKRILSRDRKRFTESSASEGGFISVKRALNFAKKLSDTSDTYILAEGSLYAPESTGCALPNKEGFIVAFATSADYIKFFEKVTQEKMDGFSRLAAQMAYGLDHAMVVAYAENTFIQGFVDTSEKLPDVDIGNVTFVDVDENDEVVTVNKKHLGTEVFDNWAHNDECPTWHKAAMALVKLLN